MPVYVGIEDNPLQWSEFSGWKIQCTLCCIEELGSGGCVVIMKSKKRNLESLEWCIIIKLMVEAQELLLLFTENTFQGLWILNPTSYCVLSLRTKRNESSFWPPFSGIRRSLCYRLQFILYLLHLISLIKAC